MKTIVCPTKSNNSIGGASLSNKRGHQINMDMGQELQINKREQRNKRGQRISPPKKIKVDVGKCT